MPRPAYRYSTSLSRSHAVRRRPFDSDDAAEEEGRHVRRRFDPDGTDVADVSGAPTDEAGVAGSVHGGYGQAFVAEQDSEHAIEARRSRREMERRIRLRLQARQNSTTIRAGR